MAKKKQNIQLEGLADLDFSKGPDIDAAQSIIEPPKEEEKPAPKPKRASAPKSRPKATPAARREAKEPTPLQASSPRSSFPPERKKRATFNVDEDLHKALKDYSFFEEVDMVEYIFEHLVKPDLAKKGYYPPKKRKR